MKMKKILQCLLAVTVTVFSAMIFASTTEKAVDAPENIYDEDKQNIIVNIKHPEFILKLKSNPTTGYSWYLREYDANLISPIKHAFQQPVKELIGASGFESWTFRVKPAGFTVPQQTTIRMVYARPWQGNGE